MRDSNSRCSRQSGFFFFPLKDESRSCLNLRCADARDSRTRISLFSCSGGRPLVPLYRSRPPSAFSTDFSSACNMQQDEPILLMPASDLPDAIEFASDSLARRWLRHLGETAPDGSDTSQVRTRLAHYAKACPRRISIAYLATFL